LLCFVVVVLVVLADTLIRILHYCPISPCFQHIAPLHAALHRQPCPAALLGSLARQFDQFRPDLMRALARSLARSVIYNIIYNFIINRGRSIDLFRIVPKWSLDGGTHRGLVLACCLVQSPRSEHLALLICASHLRAQWGK
jgi:hypothetical protein